MGIVWTPTKAIIEKSNINKIMLKVGVQSYQEFWKWSVEHKQEFWKETVDCLGIVQEKKYSSIVDTSKGVEQAAWLYESRMNIVDSCFQNKAKAIAIRFQNSKGGTLHISQKQLEEKVNQIANGLLDLGLQKEDVVAIDSPMTYEAIATYLAIVKAGMQVATIADSFSVEEIAVRLEITNPKLVFTQDYFLRAEKKHGLYKKVAATNPLKIVVFSEEFEEDLLRSEDLYFQNFLSENTVFESVKVSAQETMTILFSSGTTGAPKAIPWNHTTPIKGASDGYYHHNIQKNDVVCWPTNLGWMMGPWLVFTALINKASIALYEGTPIEKGFGNFVEKEKVTMLGVVPSIVKNWKNTQIMESYNWESIKCFSSTGEVSNPIEMEYLMQLANNKPVIEYCGGTEIGGGYIASTMVQKNYPSTFSTQTLGGSFVLLDSEGKEAPDGEVFLQAPILGLSTQLLNKNHYNTYYKDTPRYKDSVLRKHGDQFLQLENGYYKAVGRTDDSMNLGGIKVSAVQIESAIATLEFVKESAAIAISPKEGGASALVVYYVSDEKMSNSEALKKIQNCIKTKLNPLFKLVDLVKIDTLPRTASKKVKRKELRLKYQRK